MASSKESKEVSVLNPKMQELLDCIEESDAKVIVYHKFVEEGRMIEATLEKAGIEYRSLRGEIPDKEREVKDFKTDKKVRVLVAHPQSGGEGQNLQAASVMVFYSMPWGLIPYEQCKGRIYRHGQTEKCVFIFLVGRNTIDEEVLESLVKKQDLAKSVFSYIRRGGK